MHEFEKDSVTSSGKLFSKHRTIINAITSVALTPTILLIGLLRFGFLFRLLPLDVYGVFLLLSAVVAQFDFMDGGLRQSLQRYIPEFLAHDRGPDVARVVTVTLLIMFGIGLTLGGAVALFAAFGGAGIFGAGAADADIVTGLYIAAAALALYWPLNTFQAGMEGFNRFNEALMLRLISEILRTGLVIWCAYAGWSAANLFVVFMLPPMVVQLFLAVRLQSLLGLPILHLDRRSFHVLREVFYYSKWVAIGQLGSTLINSLDRLVVGAVLGVAAVPIYYALRQIVRAVSSLSVLLHKVVLPMISNQIARDGVASITRLVIVITRAQMAFLTPFIVLITLFAEPLLVLWSDGVLTGYAATLQIGLVLFLVSGSTKVLNQSAAALNSEIRFLMLYGVASAVLAIVLVYALGSYFGVSGAFLGGSVAPVLTFYYWYQRVLRRLKISPRDYAAKAVFKGVWPALLVLILSLPLLPWLSQLRSIASVLGYGGLWAIVTFGLSYFFGLDSKSRHHLRNAAISLGRGFTRRQTAICSDASRK